MVGENLEKCCYRFADFRLDAGKQMLLRGGVEVHLPKRPFQILLYLIEQREFVVSRNELLDKFWDGHDVYDEALNKCVGAIRRAIDDTDESSRFIETRRGIGYRFVGAISKEDEVVGGGLQLSETLNGKKQIENDENHKTKDDKQIPNSKIRNRQFIIGGSVAALILVVIFGLFAYRRPAETTEVKTPPGAAATRRSIAILPIKNLTGVSANDYLSDGITESLINDISRIEALKVISRGSAFQFKDKEVSVSEIGEKLGVETVLEGSLRLSGDQMRVDVRLVNTRDGGILWTIDSQQANVSDIFAVQDAISCQIVTELRVKLCGDIAPAERYTKNVKAYRLYLKGLYHRNQLSIENLNKAIGFYEQAVSIQPDYALAHDGLASVYTVMESNSHLTPGTAAAKAEFHAQKALDIDDSLPGAYIALGVAKTMRSYDLETQNAYYKRALAKNPNYRTAHLWLANNYTVQARFEEAEREILLVRELDPMSFGVRLNLSELYYYWGNSDKAIEQANLILAEYPDDATSLGLVARANVQKGDLDAAFAAIEKLPASDTNRVIVLAAAGRIEDARKLVEAAKASSTANASPYWIACLYATLGESETAFEWLEKSYQMRQYDLVSLKVDPTLRTLHRDSRYADLLRRLNLGQ